MFLTNNSKKKKIFPLLKSVSVMFCLYISEYMYILHVHFLPLLQDAFKCIAYTVNVCYSMLTFTLVCNFHYVSLLKVNTLGILVHVFLHV